MKKYILSILYLYYIYIKKKINNNNIVIVKQLAFPFLIFEQKK